MTIRASSFWGSAPSSAFNAAPPRKKSSSARATSPPTPITFPTCMGRIGTFSLFAARGLGLPDSLGIGDAAILVRALQGQFPRKPRHIGFMPHWESLPRGNWSRACTLAGIRLIDPTAPVASVFTDILGCEVLIAEAMHGAIVADALRVPWVPVLPLDHAHRDKWFDWAEALRLNFKQHRLWPSSPAEVRFATRYHPWLASVGAGLSRWPASRLSQPLLVYAAVERLAVLAQEEPCLSADPLLESACEQMLEKLRQLQAMYGK